MDVLFYVTKPKDARWRPREAAGDALARGRAALVS